MSETYFGRGTREMFDEYMDFINYVFGFNGRSEDFKKLLPKLYKYELEPAVNSYVATEDGRLRAAVGAYPFTMSVCGITLRGVGIGNVASHPYSAGSGYMTRLIDMAIDDMIADGCDLSILGGQRQRYNHFSFEHGGPQYDVALETPNMKHAFGGCETDVEMFKVEPDDKASLDFIAETYDARPYRQHRDRERLYDILATWHSVPYIFRRGDETVGYCILMGECIPEIFSTNDENFVEMLKAIMKTRSRVTFDVPDFMPQQLRILERICENIKPCTNHMFSVLCYKRVIDAFLKLKATYKKLPDGELTALIHGRAGDEQLKISVKDGETSVSEATGAYDIELDELEAIRFFFAHVSMDRREFSPFAESVFPLPIFEYPADAV
mgnify:CR=1 FL=1